MYNFPGSGRAEASSERASEMMAEAMRDAEGVHGLPLGTPSLGRHARQEASAPRKASFLERLFRRFVYRDSS